jgi:carbamoyltransferase
MKKNIVLGINWEQNSSVALMIDGKIVEAVAEERFSKLKNDERYPKLSIEYILKKYSLKSVDIDYVGFVSKLWSPTWMLIRRYTKFTVKDHLKEQDDVWYPRFYKNRKTSILTVFKNRIDLSQYPGKKFWSKYLNKIHESNHVSNKNNFDLGQSIRKEAIYIHLGIPKEKVYFYDHHLCHCAYAYFSGPFNNKKALVFSLDAFGDNSNYTCHRFEAKKNLIRVTEIVRGGNSVVARLYRYVTLLLSMTPSSHEYKTMGLAAYAKENYFKHLLAKFKKIQKIVNYKFVFINKPKDTFFAIKDMIKGERFDVVAGALQRFTEDIVLDWINKISKKHKISNICFSGGVAMNVKTNMLLAESRNIKQLYIPPTPDDTSQCIGACYAVFLEKQNEFKLQKPKKISNAYLGFEVDTKQVINFIKETVNTKKYRIIKKNINKESANLLLKNKILARISGRAEFGARALGNRSILANPILFENKNKINKSIKNRDFWMPFAATVLEEHSHKYFKFNQKKSLYKYMTNCVRSNELGKVKFGAAIHPEDKTCRPQILNKEDNKDYHNLINEFGKISGVYGLLNTSFNVHGKPIVNSLKDAYEVLDTTELDGLIMPGALIIKK